MKQSTIFALFATAVFSPNYFPALPSPLVSAGIVLFVLLVFLVTSRAWVLAIAAGLALGIYEAHNFHDQILSHDLDAQIFLVSATVTKASVRNVASQRLDLSVERAWHADGASFEMHPGKVLLSWYGDERLAVGDRVLAEAKLRRPRGLQNSGLFDYQKWLFAEGYTATGYIRKIVDLDGAHDKQLWLDQWRGKRASMISGNPGLNHAGVHQALALGDGTLVDQSTWDLFRKTGTVHLMVISGLHVGLVAGFGYLIGFAVGRCLSPIFNWNAVRMGILFSLSLALTYCAVSGFGLPAKRAFIMLLTLLLPRYFYLQVSPWLSFTAALAVISILEPRAVLQSGFWLSFGAVLLIFLGFSGAGRRRFLVGLVRTQILFFVGFSGVLMWQGIAVPSVSFQANLLAVPLVSAGLVPLEVLALSASLISESAAMFLWSICDWLIDLNISVLRYLVGLDLPFLARPAIWGWIQGLAVVSAFLLLVVPGRSFRLALAVGCLPLLVAPTSVDYLLKIRVFDVGQGTSILIQQPEYNLLYDTGPKFSERFDSGANIISPSLKQMKISKLDRLIVSHPDADHRGGLEGVLSEMAVGRVDIGKQLDLSNEMIKQDFCKQGDWWRQGQVTYRFLWPDNNQGYDDNDSSCVLLIQSGILNILVPGDISAGVERELLSDPALVDGVDLVVVPHHGSKSSSSANFVTALSPRIAIVSAGYQNQFNHPNQAVVARYEAAESRVLNTADSGAIDILWISEDTEPKVTRATDSKIFWWQK